MGASAVLRPSTTIVAPGDTATIQVTVRNVGSVVDQFTLDVVGDPAGWSTVEPAILSLFPGADGTATVRFSPPRSAATPSGPVVFGVRVASKEDLDGSTVEEGTLEVGRFADTFAELVPRTSRGALRGKHELAVDNRGNGRLNATLSAADPDELLRFEVDPPSIVAESGTAVFSRIRARPRKRFLRGRPQTRPFQVFVEPEGEPVFAVDGSLLQEALIPKWFVPMLLALGVLALVWLFLLKPTVENAARDAVAEPLAGQQAQLDQLRAAAGGAPPPPGSGSTAQPTAPSVVRELLFDSRLSGTVAPGASGSGGSYSYKVPASTTLSVTDLILQNPQGDSGTLTIRRGSTVLLEVRLDNFRDLDYHFVSPLIFKAGETLNVQVTCQTAGSQATTCRPAVTVIGTQRTIQG